VTLPVGTRLGHFIVRTPLGKGGMGEVYRATDTALERDVAIKVLPSEMADDADRLARFEREARVLAALNHPNIAHVYGFERAQVDHSTVDFLAMELVPGEDLAERLTRGPLAIDETIEIARQVAAALEQAHEAGIIHRDLKPANIKLTPDGAVKVLDFGLAKAHAREGTVPADLSHSPTFATSQTQAGLILGTAGYMAPEQVRGRRVDSRADIWAFGVVMFEMLTGKRAFAGDTVTDILAAVLRADPDWSALPAGTPQRLRALVSRCLERDPQRRLRHIGEARIALEEATSEPHDAIAPAARSMPASRAGHMWLWAVAVVVAGLLGVGVGRFATTPAATPSRPVRFEISAGAVSSAVLSPDGAALALVAQDQLWVRDMPRVETRALPKTEGAVRPFWSPDSRTIAYGAKGKLWKVAADGNGAPTVVCDLVSGLWDGDAGGAWLADGTIVYSDGNTALFQVSAQGGDPTPIVKPDPQRELHFHTVSVLPDGRSVVYVVHRAGEGVGSNTLAIWSGGQARVLLELKNQGVDDPVYSPSGHLLFQRGPTNAGVWAVPFSMSTLQTTGEPFLVAQGMRRPSVAADGTLVLLPPERQRPINLVWVDREGKTVGHIDEPRFRQTAATVSAEGDRIVVAEASEGGRSDLWQYDIRRNTRGRLTANEGAGDPRWMPDGRSVLYNVRTSTGPTIRRVAADGSGRVQEVAQGIRAVPSSDGNTIFFTRPDADGQRLFYRSFTDRDSKPVLFVDQPFYAIVASPSPDGRFVAYEAEPGPGQYQIYVRRFPPTEGTWQVSTDGGTSPRWSRDGRLFFAHGPEIMEVQVTADPEVRIGTPTVLFKRAPTGGVAVPASFEVSPDGSRFLAYEPVGDASDERITVVQHWFTEFAR